MTDNDFRLDRPLIPGMRSPLSPSQLWRILLARRQWIAVTVAVFALIAIAAALFVPDKYVGSAALVIDVPSSNPSGQDNVPSMLAENYVATQMDLLTSDRVLVRVVNQQQLADDPEARKAFDALAPSGASFKDWLADQIGESLHIASGTTSRLIRVQFSDPSPQRAAAIANAVVRAYRHVNRQLVADPSRARLESYTAYLDELRSKVDTAQQKLTSAQQKSGVIDRNGSSQSDTERLQDLGIKLNQAESDHQTAQAEVARIEKLRGQNKPVTAQADILSSRLVQQLKGQLTNLQSQRAKLAKALGPKNPRMQSLSAQIATVQSRLRNEVDAYLKANRSQTEVAAARESALRDALTRERGDVLAQQKKRDQIASLVRRLDGAQQVYKAALGRYDQVLGGSQLQSYNVSIVSWASPPRWPSGMSGKTKLALGLVFGAMVGCALALLVELLGRRVRDSEDITRELGLPVLGDLSV